MESLEAGIGLDIVAWFNSAPKVVKLVLLPFHLAGSEYGYLLLLPIVFWSYSKDAGRRLLVLILGTATANSLLKAWWMRPRPFLVDPERITPFFTEHGYGLPSGHTMFATVTGIWLISRSRNPRVRSAAVAFIIIMGISRMVHGVHYPQDVIVGWAMGGFLAACFLAQEEGIGRWLSGDPRITKIAGIGTILVLLFVAVLVLFPEHETRKGILSTASALAFGSCGACIEAGAVGFSVKGTVSGRIVRSVVGLVSLVAVYFLLTAGYYAVAGEKEGAPILILYCIRYGLVGIWVTLAAPGLFVRTHLSESIT